MADELAKFESDREDQLRVMKERHIREIAAFDTSLSPSSTISSATHHAFKANSQFSSSDSPSGSHASFKCSNTPI